MQLTKEQLTDALEQGLSISTKNGNIKIVAIVNDIYGVNHFNSNKVQWWLFENFERNEAKIEQPKQKYTGRVVKCDTVEQLRYIATKHKSEYLNYIELNLKEKYNYYDYEKDTFRSETGSIDAYLEIISFSQYCKENNLTEPKWIQGFEVKDGYNDVVAVSNDSIHYTIAILRSVYNSNSPFITSRGSFKFARYPKKNEINEIKFVD